MGRREPLNQEMSRRAFGKQLGMVAAAAALSPHTALSEKSRTSRVGHTGITWQNSAIDQAIHDVGTLGFFGFETFGDVLVKKDNEGNLGQLLESNHLPLISGYCTINLTDATAHDQ